MATEDAKNTPSQEQMPDKGRRDTLKTLATVPILGALAYGVYQKRKDALRGRNISDVFQVSNRQAPIWSRKAMARRSVSVWSASVFVESN